MQSTHTPNPFSFDRQTVLSYSSNSDNDAYRYGWYLWLVILCYFKGCRTKLFYSSVSTTQWNKIAHSLAILAINFSDFGAIFTSVCPWLTGSFVPIQCVRSTNRARAAVLVCAAIKCATYYGPFVGLCITGSFRPRSIQSYRVFGFGFTFQIYNMFLSRDDYGLCPV